MRDIVSNQLAIPPSSSQEEKGDRYIYPYVSSVVRMSSQISSSEKVIENKVKIEMPILAERGEFFFGGFEQEIIKVASSLTVYFC